MEITLSMSAIATFNRCPKKFQLRYLLGWEDDKPEKEALALGTSFHGNMEHYAKKLAGMPYEQLDWATPMGEVAIGYIQSCFFPKGEDILSVDDPHYIQVLPGIRLRTTFDLVYTEGLMLVVRDYKTFDRAPSLDIDLDFQARVYLWAAMQLWPGFLIYRFEHEYVRRCLPNVPKDKAGNCWTPDDCYKRQSMILNENQIEEDGVELLQTIADIRREIIFPRIWKRVNLKGGGYDQCASCPVKELCKAEKQGNLNNESDYLALAVRKDTIYATNSAT